MFESYASNGTRQVPPHTGQAGGEWIESSTPPLESFASNATRSPERRAPERPRNFGYANTGYPLENDDELAVSSTDYLRHRLPSVLIADDAGIQDGLMSYFRQLCG